MIAPRYAIPRFQSDFYRDSYYKMLRWLIVCLFIILILIGAIFYFVIFTDQRSYYASTTTGQIIPLTPHTLRSGQ